MTFKRSWRIILSEMSLCKQVVVWLPLLLLKLVLSGKENLNSNEILISNSMKPLIVVLSKWTNMTYHCGSSTNMCIYLVEGHTFCPVSLWSRLVQGANQKARNGVSKTRSFFSKSSNSFKMRCTKRFSLFNSQHTNWWPLLAAYWNTNFNMNSDLSMFTRKLDDILYSTKIIWTTVRSA